MTDEHPILYTWTAQEAYAVVGFLERLTEVLWVHQDQGIHGQQPRYEYPSRNTRAVVDFLEQLAETIWSRYGPAISAECFTHPAEPGHQRQLRLPFPECRDLEIPF